MLAFVWLDFELVLVEVLAMRVWIEGSIDAQVGQSLLPKEEGGRNSG